MSGSLPSQRKNKPSSTSPRPAHQAGRDGGIFEDYNFRFSSTYNPVESSTNSTGSGGAGSSRPTRVAASQSVRAARPSDRVSPPPAGLLVPSLSSSTHGIAAEKATANAASAAEERRRVHEEAAAALLQHARGRRADTVPLFVSSAPVAVSAEAYRPADHSLQPPSLGLAVGADLELVALTTSERQALQAREQHKAPALFKWWAQREAVRVEQRDVQLMEEALRAPLLNGVRELIGREENYWLKEQMSNTTSSVIVNPSSKPLYAGGGTSGVLAQPGPRSTSVPLKHMESLFQGVRVLLHQRSIVLLNNYKNQRQVDRSQKEAARQQRKSEEDALADANGVPRTVTVALAQDEADKLEASAHDAYVDFFIETEQQLLKEAVASADSASATSSMLPSEVSLPPERVLGPLLGLETAASVTLLWRVLEQVKSVVPGMNFAMQLFQHYILPHVYENYTSYASVLPQLGALSEQVALFATLPLRARTCRLATTSALQLKDDAKYMEQVLRQWSLRTWRNSVRSQRLRARHTEKISAVLRRRSDQRQLQGVFAAWKHVARVSAHQAFLSSVEAKYQTFIEGSDITARIDNVPQPEMPGHKGSETAQLFDRSKFLSSKLIETSRHIKAKAKAALTAEDGGGDGEEAEPQDVQRGLARPLAPPPQQQQQHQQEQPEVGSARPRPTPPRGAAALGANPPPVADASGQITTFDDMLQKLKDMEGVCGHLRDEIAIQSNMIQKLNREKGSLAERNRKLENDVMQTVKEKLHYCNLVQDKQLLLYERDRQIVQLKSRLRAHRHRPWQRAIFRVIGNSCGVSTKVAEEGDHRRIHEDIHGDAASPSMSGAAGNDRDSEDADESTEPAHDTAATERELAKEEERLFGDLAPLVLASIYPLPDPVLILQDWTNSCLDDLQALDDLKGGALSVRASAFSEEFRSGVLLSRLLFYLALPRYLQRRAHGEDFANTALKLDETGEVSRYEAHRQQLLGKHNVQLEAPFPTYSECFGDLLQMPPAGRMFLLLHFATALTSVSDVPQSEVVTARRDALLERVTVMTGLTQPPPSAPLLLQEVVDPHALVEGERSAVITMVGMLYMRFAHPFNHKCRQSAEVERSMMLQLLSKGEYNPNASTSEGQSLREQMLSSLEDEDKTPWQLFKEKCLPVFGSAAHPFLLRGNFWPSDAFESPQLAEMLGAMGMALQRSLQLHRWHILTTCLVPVPTYTGLSRGVFTGPRAAASALRLGLDAGGQWVMPVGAECLRAVFQRREERLAQVVEKQLVKVEDVLCAPSLADPEVLAALLPPSTTPSSAVGQLSTAAVLSREVQVLLQTVQAFSEDLGQLFLQHASFAAELALPALDLSAWRLLCGDLGVLPFFSDEGEITEGQVDMATATSLFSEAVRAASGIERQDLSTAATSTSTSATEHNPSVTAIVALPTVRTQMTYPAFLVALALLADACYPPAARATLPRSSIPAVTLDPVQTETPATDDEGEAGPQELADTVKPPKQLLWLGDAIGHVVSNYVKSRSAGKEGAALIVQQLLCGPETQQTIAVHTPLLLVAFHAYSRDLYGCASMEREDLLRMLRDAMVTSTEISQYLIYELFQHFCVVRKNSEEAGAASRREQDARPRDGHARRTGRSVKIMASAAGSSIGSESTSRKPDVQVLLFDGFVRFLCVLCNFKQPNPLIAFGKRLRIFLRRSLLRPLALKVDQIGPLLNASRAVTREDGNDATGADV